MSIAEYIIFVDGVPYGVIRSTPPHQEEVAGRYLRACGVDDAHLPHVTLKLRALCTAAEYALAMVE